MTLDTLDTIERNALKMLDNARERLSSDDLTGEQRGELLVDMAELVALTERVNRWREELVAA
jgi:hypothetical protein